MPNRILREGILESEPVCSLSWAAEVLYRRLISVVDDYGRFSASPKLIRAKCYPIQIDKVSDPDIGKWLTQVVEAGLVRVYPASDGKRYLQVEKFGQQVRSKSKYPDPDDECDQLLADATHPLTNEHLDVDVDVDERASNLPSGKLEVDASANAPPPLADEGPKANRCPLQDIVALYHAELPQLPTVEKLTAARQGYLRQRWREDLPTLEAWRRYFQDVSASDFLMGRSAGRDGKPPFRADLEWLTRPGNFAKVAEGKYHGRA